VFSEPQSGAYGRGSDTVGIVTLGWGGSDTVGIVNLKYCMQQPELIMLTHNGLVSTSTSTQRSVEMYFKQIPV